MTEQTVPADKVRELKTKYEYDTSGDPERLLDHLLHDLDDLLPAPPQPTTGLLGRWAKHPEHGDVVCVWDKPKDGWINVYKRANNGVTDAEWYQIRFSELTFPHQATKPEDVPAGEAWRVRHCEDGEFNAVKTSGRFPWQFFNPEIEEHDGFRNNSVTLVCPLTPERPASDLQARYDDLEKRWKHRDVLFSERGRYLIELGDKYREAQERIKTLEQANTPRTVTTEAEYAALPDGSIVGQPDQLDVYIKNYSRGWDRPNTTAGFTSRDLAGTTRTVLRYGWGDEQPKPAWRIEHDHTNLRVGEYIIDKNNHTGTIRAPELSVKTLWQDTATGAEECAPFIVFPNRDAATPEAIEEAKQARDKETGE